VQVPGAARHNILNRAGSSSMGGELGCMVSLCWCDGPFFPQAGVQEAFDILQPLVHVWCSDISASPNWDISSKRDTYINSTYLYL
jgi:hypothetical protein